MKTLILAAAALPIFAGPAFCQDAPQPVKQPEEIRRATQAAWLGISLQESEGILTVGLVAEKSPAAEAGLREGDVLLSFNGKPAGGAGDFAAKVASAAPGQEVELTIRRDNKEQTVKVKLGERPAFGDADRGNFRREDLAKMLEEAEMASEKAVKEAREAEAKLRQKVMEKARKLQEKSGKQGDPSAKENCGDGECKKDDCGRESCKEGACEAPQDKGMAKMGKPGQPGRPGLLRWLAAPEQHHFDFHVFPGPRAQQLWKNAPMLRQFHAAPQAPAPQPGAEQVWKQVEQSIGRALKENGIAPDVIEKVMQAVKSARENAPGSPRARLQAEAQKLEREMKALRARQEKLQQQLKATE